jgi:class 3 adenylate cyclase
MTDGAKPVNERAKQLNQDPRLVGLVKQLREAMPGDHDLESKLAEDDDERWASVGRNLQKLTEGEKPGLLGQLGLGAVQALRALADRGAEGEEETGEITILFTDLVQFSDWALRAGDKPAIRLLGKVVDASEAAVEGEGGEVIKWIGDGMMAAFGDPCEALDAVEKAHRKLAKVEVEGYTPRLRAGIHCGTPQRDRDDYLGVDVNIAARVADAAKANELLLSAAAAESLEESAGRDLDLRRKRFFKAKGVPKDMEVYAMRLGS